LNGPLLGPRRNSAVGPRGARHGRRSLRRSAGPRPAGPQRRRALWRPGPRAQQDARWPSGTLAEFSKGRRTRRRISPAAAGGCPTGRIGVSRSRLAAFGPSPTNGLRRSQNGKRFSRTSRRPTRHGDTRRRQGRHALGVGGAVQPRRRSRRRDGGRPDAPRLPVDTTQRDARFMVIAARGRLAVGVWDRQSLV
jgi:hypothetical protein